MAMKLKTALLRHTTRDGLHFDWLLTDPRDPAGLLWTARTGRPSDEWAKLPCWDLTPISGHRRTYLTYEGPVSGDRGEVSRVDQGYFTAELWTDARIVIDLRFERCEGRVEMTQLSDVCWRAAWL